MNNSQLEPAPSQYAEAFASIRKARTLCLLAILAAVLLQLGGFYMVHIRGVVDAAEGGGERFSRVSKEARAAKQSPAATKPAATAPATPADKPIRRPNLMPSEAAGNAVMWKSALTWIFDACKTLSPIVGLFLTIVILLAVQFSLLGRLGGTAELTGALLWSILLLVMLCPWQDILRGTFACGVMYSLDELLAQARQVRADSADPQAAFSGASFYYYIRFVALPLLALLIWTTVCVKFSRGTRRIVAPVAVIDATVEQDAGAPE